MALHSLHRAAQNIAHVVARETSRLLRAAHHIVQADIQVHPSQEHAVKYECFSSLIATSCHCKQCNNRKEPPVLLEETLLQLFRGRLLTTISADDRWFPAC